MSDLGFLNELLIGSGWKVSRMSLPPVWLRSLKVNLCHLMGERPLEGIIKFSPHDDKEEGHVCVLTDAITQDVEMEAHFVAIPYK